MALPDTLPPKKLYLLTIVVGLFAIVTAQTVEGTFSVFMTAMGAALIAVGAVGSWRSRRD